MIFITFFSRRFALSFFSFFLDCTFILNRVHLKQPKNLLGVEFFLILKCGSSILQLGKFKKRKRKLASKFDFIYETWKPCLNLNAKEPYNAHRNRNTQIFALSLRTKRSFSYIGSIYITLLSLDYLWELHGLAIKSGSPFYPKITIFFYVGIYKTLRIFSGYL